MNIQRLREIREKFVDEMSATGPEGYREVVIELLMEIRRTIIREAKQASDLGLLEEVLDNLPNMENGEER
jgi:hypothetical protein